MKSLNAITKFLIISVIMVLVSTSITLNYAQNSKLINNNKMEDIIANYEHSLNSENDGIRIATVEHVGRYKISNFENKLIELLNNEENCKQKQIIASSLFQLGSLKSISEIKKSYMTSSNCEYKEFCTALLDKYGEYDKLRSEYFETLVVNIHKTQ